MSAPVQTRLVRTWHRLIFRWRRAQLDRELAEEIESHRLMKLAENGRAGVTAQAAGELSRRQMGNIEMAREECRDMWGFVKLDRLLQDLRYAVRVFGRTPGFTAIAVLSLAIGIGGNAAMFSLVDKLLVQPLPYRDPDRLVRITGIYPRAAVPFFQQQSRGMDVAAVSFGWDYNLTGQGEAIRIVGSAASANLFSVMGAPAARGRSFEPGEDLPGRDSVVILSDSLWKNKFGGGPGHCGPRDHAERNPTPDRRNHAGRLQLSLVQGGGVGAPAAGPSELSGILGSRVCAAGGPNETWNDGSTGAR